MINLKTAPEIEKGTCKGCWHASQSGQCPHDCRKGEIWVIDEEKEDDNN